MREVRLLKRLHHENIVQLKEVVVGTKRELVFLVFQYYPHDLSTLLDTMPTPFVLPEIKTIIRQLLQVRTGETLMHALCVRVKCGFEADNFSCFCHAKGENSLMNVLRRNQTREPRGGCGSSKHSFFLTHLVCLYWIPRRA